MRKIIEVLSGGVMLAAMTSPALAQNSASASASGSVTIIQPLSISKSADLAFGSIVKPNTATSSTIAIDASGTRTITNGTAVAANTGSVSAAKFTVSGEGAQHFSISLPSTFNMTGPGASLVVTTTNPGATGLLSGSIGSLGSMTFGVGGSFVLASSQASGAYSGSFVVTVAYN